MTKRATLPGTIYVPGAAAGEKDSSLGRDQSYDFDPFMAGDHYAHTYISLYVLNIAAC